jgi:hypothetical protein
MENAPQSNQQNKENIDFVNEVNFIQKHGQEPDSMEKHLINPETITSDLVKQMDRMAHGAAIVTLLLKDANNLDPEINTLVQKFAFDGEYGKALMRMNTDLLQAQSRLKEKVGLDKVRDMLPETEALQAEIHERNIDARYGDY